MLVDSSPFQPIIAAYEVNDETAPVDLDAALSDILELLAERNFDLYETVDATIKTNR